MEGLVGIEPTTQSLKGSCSTTELQAQVKFVYSFTPTAGFEQFFNSSSFLSAGTLFTEY